MPRKRSEPFANPFPHAIRQSGKETVVINELCTCGHFRSQHFSYTQFGHGNCMICETCKRFTWKQIILSSGHDTLDKYLAYLNPFTAEEYPLDEGDLDDALALQKALDKATSQRNDLSLQNSNLQSELYDLQEKVDKILRKFDPKEGEERTILVDPKKMKHDTKTKERTRKKARR